MTREADINETAYMLPGTLRLISQIVNVADTKNPYDSIVFLDKSARPSAYLFLLLVKKMKESHLIEQGIQFPKIKFMDIGKTDDPWKFDSPEAASLMREKLPPKEIAPKGETSRVLIVDEFMDTGKTLKNAVRVFKDTYGVDAEGTYQFDAKKGPFWYRNNNKKLVEDANINEYVRNFLSLPLEELRRQGYNIQDLESFKYLSNKLPKPAFTDIYYKRIDDISKNIETTSENLNSILKQSGIEPTKEMLTHISVIAKTNIRILPEGIYDYYKTAGGRFAVAERGDRKRSFELRKMIERVSSLVVERMKQNDK